MEVDGSRRTMVRLCGLVFSVVVRKYRFDSLLDLQIYIARRLGWFWVVLRVWFGLRAQNWMWGCMAFSLHV